MAFVVSGELGVKLDTVYDAPNTTTNPEVPGLPFALGQAVRATQDQRYVFVKSSGVLAQYAAVCIDEDFTARACTSTLALQANSFGAAQVAFATDQYGWVAVHGHGLQVLTKDAVGPNDALYTSASVGVLTAVASTGDPILVDGVRSVASASSGGGATAIIATYPQFTVHNRPSNIIA
jgi:hypothetical protein